MNYSGEVKLIRADKVIHSFLYYDRETRKKIIDRWRRLYREEFDSYFLQISPVVIESKTSVATEEGKLTLCPASHNRPSFVL